MEMQVNQLVKRFEIPIVAGLLAWGTIFLLKMAYLPFYQSTIVGWAFLLAVYLYVKSRFGMKIPILLLFLVYATVAMDGLGNLFGLYNRRFQYVQYDEFTHTAAPALAAPIVVWLLNEGLKKFNYSLPLSLVTFFALTTMFTISGFYEIVELWDDKYMHPVPGMRIHSPYDTPNDLQCDLFGLVIGGLIAYLILKRREAVNRED